MAYRAFKDPQPISTGAEAYYCRHWQAASRDLAPAGTGRGWLATAAPGCAAVRSLSRNCVRAVGAGISQPYAGTRVDRLLAEKLIHPGADIALLEQPVHAERVEHLLTICAMALTKRSADTVAPWTRKRGLRGAFAMLKKFKQMGMKP